MERAKREKTRCWEKWKENSSYVSLKSSQVFFDSKTVKWPKYTQHSLKRFDISNHNLFFIINWGGGVEFLHMLQDNLSLSPTLIFLKNELLIKLLQRGEIWRICLQVYNQQHMNSAMGIKLHILTSCLTHQDLKFGPWYKVSTWMTLRAIIKIPWNKGFQKIQ